LVLVGGALTIGSANGVGTFNPGWVVPVAALIAAVAVVGMAALSFGSNRSDIVIRGDTMIPERSLGDTASSSAGTPAAGTPAKGTTVAGTPAASTPTTTGTPTTSTPKAGTPAAGTPAAGTPAAGTPTAPTTTASITTQEPVIVTAAVTAILQVIVIAGFHLDAATQATIVGGLSALAGVFVRGRVSPVQTQVRAG
jgi:hypothetical protein